MDVGGRQEGLGGRSLLTDPLLKAPLSLILLSGSFQILGHQTTPLTATHESL